ncbi:Bug family tripartite tricarboxylate transporter substrate binding protein [Hydrogenophaga sp. OTU3427]|uniref:Bug family tripartite tricarboxylate transporter substrate binding protein n=1 Tax=Hydrogenophaga sp. OTU3427 TaxID=3043856 RepID=UPI00313F2978
MLSATLASAGALGVVSTASAQAYPSGIVKLVIPSAPGGSIDASGRLIADALSRQLGTRVIVDNKAGAGGVIGIDNAAKSPADGYTLVIGIAATLGVQPAVKKTMPYDTARDIAPIGVFAQGGLVMAVPVASAVKTIQDFKVLSAGKGELKFGTGGQATFGHLTGEVMKAGLGVPMRHVPYKGSGPAVTDLAGGLLDFVISDAFSATPYVQSGKIRVIATAGPTRHVTFPDVPTLSESGLPFERGTWVGLFAPAGVPAPVMAKLTSSFDAITADAQFKTDLRKLGFTPVAVKANESKAMLLKDIDAWKQVATAAGLQMQ